MDKTFLALLGENVDVANNIEKYETIINDLIEEGVLDPTKSYTPDEMIEKGWFTPEELRDYAISTEKAIPLTLTLETKAPFTVAKLVYRADKFNLWSLMGAEADTLRGWHVEYTRINGKRALNRSKEWLATLNRVYEKYFVEILPVHPSLQEYVESTNITTLDAMRQAIYPENAMEWLPYLPDVDKQGAPLYRERAFEIADKRKITVPEVTYQMVAESIHERPILPKHGDTIKVSRLPVQLRGSASPNQYVKILSTEVLDDITFRQTYQIMDSPEEEGEVFTKEQDE